MLQILDAESSLECKQLSREILDYDEDNWRQVVFNMCCPGIEAKFAQNEELKEVLMDTEDLTLVESSYDKH